jgi:hypothetical protein
MGYVYFTTSINGQRLIGHDGDTLLFHAGLVLIPDQQTGIFVAYNSSGGPMARERLVLAFLDRYFPPATEVSVKAMTGPGSSRSVTGWYRQTRTAFHDISKLFSLFNTTRVTRTADGKLSMPGSSGEGSKLWVEIAPSVFSTEDGKETRVFGPDRAGEGHYMFYDNSPGGAVLAAERVGWTDSPPLHYALIGFSLGAFLSGGLIWPALALIRRVRRRPASTAPVPRLLRWCALAMCLCGIGFVAGVAWSVADLTLVFQTIHSQAFKVVFGLGVLTALLSAVTAIGALLAWKDRLWNVVSRLHFTLVALAGLAFVWELYHWNLLGFRL